ncbi:MAG: LysR family transcriptional regulator [Hyphomonadaceae bacterium]
MHDWDDLRLFLAAARAGSLNGAAKRVGVDAATMGRRLARLETALKATLFTRSSAGLQLTAAGQQLLDIGLEAESAMEAAGDVGAPDVMGGAVRIGAAEGFGAFIVAPSLPQLRARRPNLRIELAAQANLLSATKREVDVSVTLSAPHAARLSVEPLTDYQLGLYAHPSYLKKAGAPESALDLSRFEIVGYVDDLIFAPELRYLSEIHPGLKPTLSSSSIRAQQEMIAAGGGIGVLPCFMAQGLTRVLAQDVRLMRRFWLSIHRDLMKTARVRVVRDWLKELVRVKRRELNPPRAL